MKFIAPFYYVLQNYFLKLPNHLVKGALRYRMWLVITTPVIELYKSVNDIQVLINAK